MGNFHGVEITSRRKTKHDFEIIAYLGASGSKSLEP